MKKIFLLASLLFSLASERSSAQGTAFPYQSNLESYSQMWNPANTYYYLVTKALLGGQLDTGTNATAFSLGICKWNPGYLGQQNQNNPLATDTSFSLTPIRGTGQIGFGGTILKCTGTPTVTVALMESTNGVPGTFHAVAGVAVLTLSPTSLTVGIGFGFDVTQKVNAYYELLFTGSSSSTYSVQAWWDFTKNITYSPAK